MEGCERDGAGPERRASAGARIRRVPTAKDDDGDNDDDDDDDENDVDGRSPSPKTAPTPTAGPWTTRFTGVRARSPWRRRTGPSGSPSPSRTAAGGAVAGSGGPGWRTRNCSCRTPSAGCRRSRQVWCGAGRRGPAGQRRHTGRRRAGSAGTGRPSTAPPAGSTSCLC